MTTRLYAVEKFETQAIRVFAVEALKDNILHTRFKTKPTYVKSNTKTKASAASQV